MDIYGKCLYGGGSGEKVEGKRKPVCFTGGIKILQYWAKRETDRKTRPTTPLTFGHAQGVFESPHTSITIWPNPTGTDVHGYSGKAITPLMADLKGDLAIVVVSAIVGSVVYMEALGSWHTIKANLRN